MTGTAQSEDLLRDVSALRTENAALQAKLAAAMAQNASLSNTVACLYTLHASLDRAAILQGVDEIVINLIGSEEFAVVQWKSERGWRVVRTFGVDPEAVAARIAVMPELTNVVISGRASVSPGAQSAAIPLLGEAGVVAVVVVFRLLPQKPAFLESDYELFDLLTTHAGLALDAAALRENRA